MQTQLSALVSNIVEGVLHGISSKITSLEGENKQLKVIALENKSDRAEQYSRRNCLRLSGIPESKGESVDDKVLEITNTLGANLSIDEIDRTHRLGKMRGTESSGKPRDIIIKFTSYRARQKLLHNKKQLKEKGYERIFINEDLTLTRDNIHYQTRKMVKEKLIQSTWTKDGTIVVRDKDSKYYRIETQSDLDHVKNIICGH